jgi:hypothetical protein
MLIYEVLISIIARLGSFSIVRFGVMSLIFGRLLGGLSFLEGVFFWLIGLWTLGNM